MTQIVKLFPKAVKSNVAYDGVMVENLQYDPIGKVYTARVYGVCRGVYMPLTFNTAVAVRQIEYVVVSDSEIDAVQTDRPEMTDRLDAAMVVAFARLTALVNEQPVNPYA
jgi:hypothetical protein